MFGFSTQSKHNDGSQTLGADNNFLSLILSGVGAKSASGPPKVLFCQKFGQNPEIFGQRSFDIF